MERSRAPTAAAAFLEFASKPDVAGWIARGHGRRERLHTAFEELWRRHRGEPVAEPPVDDDLDRFLSQLATHETPPPPRSGTLRSDGDVRLGAHLHAALDLDVRGNVVLGAGARLDGRIVATGDVVLHESAHAGSVRCGGRLRLGPGARVDGSIEVEGGVSLDVHEEPPRPGRTIPVREDAVLP